MASVTQNRNSIVDIESRLVEGLNTQEQLIDEIHVLQSNDHTVKLIIAALAVAVILSLVATVVAVHASMRADRAVYQVDIIQRGSGLHEWHITHEGP